jgi:uncharacterized damage-inducible protein DinB
MIQRLAHQPDSMNFLLSSFDEISVRSRPIKDKWSIFENLAHLARYQEVFLSRIQKMLDGQNPAFSRYMAEGDAEFATWCNKNFNELKVQSRDIRTHLNEKLKSLTNEQLQLTGVHPVFGAMTIETWTEFFLLHEAHHFFTIFKLAPLLRQNAKRPGSADL